MDISHQLAALRAQPSAELLKSANRYLPPAVTLVLILRKMSRRFNAGESRIDHDVPYGPREPLGPGTTANATATEEVAVR